MKKMRWMCLALVCSFLLGMTAKADVVWEPDNDFWKMHREDCQRVERRFEVNVTKKNVPVYEDPLTNKVVDYVYNGDILYISIMYNASNGVQWGYYDEIGWLPMDYLTVVYDGKSFQEEYADQIKKTDGVIWGPVTIQVWKYPGKEGYRKFTTGDQSRLEKEKIFVDEDGITWVYCFYQSDMFWICLDDLEANEATLYPNGAPDRSGEKPAPYSGKEIKPVTSSNMIVVVVAVVAVVGATLGVLVTNYKKERNKRNMK